ncbi:type 1 fimbrial protein [Serratia fonticola]|uniref:fimbrial protein n=1 Tax=Serratia fonticola TaxID=47917 RepID=UPI001AE26ADF|nr:fimbrial protein [Serratia fonticola]MBP1038844.1 type 1 fimbrial protein [Serratia fonticola]
MMSHIIKEIRLFRYFIGLTAILLSQDGAARCFWKTPTGVVFFTPVKNPITVPLTNRSATGAVLATQSVIVNSSPAWPAVSYPAGTSAEVAPGNFQVRCLLNEPESTPSFTLRTHTAPAYDSASDSYYHRNFPQVGVRLKSAFGSSESFLRNLPTAPQTASTGSYQYYSIQPFEVEYVRTSLPLGTLPSSIRTIAMTFPMEPGSSANSIPETSSISLLNPQYGLSYRFEGCTIQSKTVRLPRVGLNSSVISLGSGIGTTSGDTKFSITMVCPADMSVAVTLTDNAVGVTGFSGVLLNNGGTASGIGVEVLSGDTSVTLGRPIALGVIPMGTKIFPLIARYFQYEDETTPGTVMSSMNITLTYP